MLTLEAFKRARSVLQGVLRPTPLIHSPYLSKLCGNNGSMIACQGYYEYLRGLIAGPELNAYATMGADEVYTVLDRFSTGYPENK